jgi:hypothetical protein
MVDGSTAELGTTEPRPRPRPLFVLRNGHRVANRATGLGKFAPTGRLFTLASFLENYRSSPNYWATFVHGKIYVWILTKIVWATFWATFWQNPSGHPGCKTNLAHGSSILSMSRNSVGSVSFLVDFKTCYIVHTGRNNNLFCLCAKCNYY